MQATCLVRPGKKDVELDGAGLDEADGEAAGRSAIAQGLPLNAWPTTWVRRQAFGAGCAALASARPTMRKPSHALQLSVDKVSAVRRYIVLAVGFR